MIAKLAQAFLTQLLSVVRVCHYLWGGGGGGGGGVREGDKKLQRKTSLYKNLWLRYKRINTRLVKLLLYNLT